MKRRDELPKGWDEKRVKKALAHYERQTELEATAEDEVAWNDRSATFIEGPTRPSAPMCRDARGAGGSRPPPPASAP